MFSFQPAPPATDAAASPTTAVRRGAKAIVASESGMLLVKEQHDDGRAFWTLPGGGVERGESPTAGLKRELREELRCDSVVGDAVSTFWYAHASSSDTVSRYVVLPAALLSEARPVRAEGILAAAWTDPTDPPATVLPQVRRLVRRLHRSRDTPHRALSGGLRG
jgi:ADP-ribose pyrophosphatase YjhB (NUDIX family)